MKYVGVDYHKEYSYMVVMDEKGVIEKESKVDNSREAVKGFLTGYGKEELKGVLEATRNWEVMYDILEEVMAEVKLAHPLKVKWIWESRSKSDPVDAKALAHLLRCNLIPEAHINSKGAREAKKVLRQRMFYVRISTMIKNRIGVMLDKYPQLARPEVSDIFGKKGLEWLKEVELRDIDKKILEQDLEFYQDVRRQIDCSNEMVEELGKDDERVKLLQTIPGIGRFFALLLVHEIDDINRFIDAKRLCAYAGIIPSTWASGGKISHGRMTKQGNKFIRWAVIEAVWPAIRKDESLRYYYNRIKQKKGANKAKVATARRLLEIIYCVLKENRSFEIRESRSLGRPHNYLVVSR